MSACVFKVCAVQVKSLSMCNKIIIPSCHGSPFKRFLTDFDQIESIGKGGFGRVFMARQKLLSENYAIKIVRQRPWESFSLHLISSSFCWSFTYSNSCIFCHTFWSAKLCERQKSSQHLNIPILFDISTSGVRQQATIILPVIVPALHSESFKLYNSIQHATTFNQVTASFTHLLMFHDKIEHRFVCAVPVHPNGAVWKEDPQSVDRWEERDASRPHSARGVSRHHVEDNVCRGIHPLPQSNPPGP